MDGLAADSHLTKGAFSPPLPLPDEGYDTPPTPPVSWASKLRATSRERVREVSLAGASTSDRSHSARSRDDGWQGTVMPPLPPEAPPQQAASSSFTATPAHSTHLASTSEQTSQAPRPVSRSTRRAGPTSLQIAAAVQTEQERRTEMQRAQCTLAVIKTVLSSFEWMNSSGLAAYAAGASAVSWQINRKGTGDYGSDDDEVADDNEEDLEGMMTATGPEVDAEIEVCKCLVRNRLLREMRQALANVKRASIAVANAIPNYEHAGRDAIWNASLQGVKQRVNGVAGALQSVLEMEQVRLDMRTLVAPTTIRAFANEVFIDPSEVRAIRARAKDEARPAADAADASAPLGASGTGAQLIKEAQDSALRRASLALSRQLLAQAQSDAEQSQSLFSRIDSAMDFIIGQYRSTIKDHLIVVTRERALLTERAIVAAGQPVSLIAMEGGPARPLPIGESGARILRLAMTESDTQLERMNVALAKAKTAAKVAIEARAAATLARSSANAERAQGGPKVSELAFPPLGLSQPMSAEASAAAAEAEAEAAEAKARELAAAAPPQQSLQEADRATKIALARAGIVFGVVRGGRKDQATPMAKLNAFGGVLVLLDKVSVANAH